MSEERIFVIIAETVQTSAGSIIQPCGRAMAQSTHVVSKMRLKLLWEETKKNGGADGIEPWHPITTIDLACRDSSELNHVYNLLQNAGIGREKFDDENPDVYGTKDPVTTSICTHPVLPSAVLGLTDYLPLWNHGRSL